MKYVNKDSYDFFEELLNEMPGLVQVKGINLNAGSVIRANNEDEFVSLFNRWVSACMKKNIMVKNRATEIGKQCMWNTSLSDTAKVAKSYEVLKGIM